MTVTETKDSRFTASRFTLAQIDSCIGLKPAYLAILRLSIDHDYNEIMAALNLKSIGTVKSRLNRARLALLAAFKHPNGAPMYSRDGTMLDEHGNRSIFDDVDQ